MYVIEKPKKYAVLVLGAGGTGSWLCAFLDKQGLYNDVVIFDGDIIEEKNVLRQNFKLNDVGRLKSQVVANANSMSYVQGFISSTDILHEVMEEFPEDVVPMLVGCLDNNASRKLAHDFMSEVDNCVWIDGGNAERHGQVYIAIKENGQLVEGYESPLDLDVHFQNFEGDERRPDQISCAEQSESAPQNVTANVTSATALFNTIAIFLHGGLLLSNLIVWDTRTLSMTPQTA